ncbi:MAG TPA: OmpW family outer membrane protein [Candidatus Acidoferrales bacterium]|nr:OmpW family outer membrane protein [Candidatus Acidoferrales bacterium]
MFMRRMMVLIFILSCGAPAALAQSHNIEITPFGGGKFGGKIGINAGTVDNLLIKSSVDYGVTFDYGFWDTFQAEFTWERQPTALSAHDVSTQPPTVTRLSNINLDTYQFGILYDFRDTEAKVRPFFGAGVGFTHFGQASVNGQDILPFGNKLAYNVGGGVKYYFSRYVGLRFDARWLRTRTTPGQGQVCGFQGCFVVPITNHANQFPINLGLIFRF